MKKLYIRYFKHKDDQIPFDSTFLCDEDQYSYNMVLFMNEYLWNAARFFLENPDGKVDFVWLS